MENTHHITDEELIAKFMALSLQQQREIIAWLACDAYPEDTLATL